MFSERDWSDPLSRIPAAVDALTTAAAPFVLTPDGLRRDRVLVWDADGRLTAVRPRTPREQVQHEHAGCLLIPGFVNAHSHACQRLLRGRSSAAPRDRADADFWGWRAVMYRAIAALDPDGVETVAAQCYLEMARAGIAAVGEFHYLRHDPAGRPYAEPNELALRLVRAAQRVGIRLVLLDAAYARGGFQCELDPVQRRFAEADPAAFAARHEALGARCAGEPLVRIAPAAHSVRALDREWLAALAALRAQGGGPLHMHVAEQEREVAECRAEHGLTPLQLAAAAGLLTPEFTAVHATCCDDDDVARLEAAGAFVCLCPSTERDLGDGFPRSRRLAEMAGRVCLGSDSNLLIDPLEELRAVENHERLVRGARVILAAPEGRARRVGRRLFMMATEAGAQSLGLDTGRLAVGAPADYAALDLRAPEWEGLAPEELLEAVALTGHHGMVRALFVAGRPVVVDGRHPEEEAITHRYRRLMATRRRRGGTSDSDA